MGQHAASLEEDAGQPRLAMVADGTENTKTRERTEGATTAVPVMHGDSCTAQKIQEEPKNSISFDMKTEPPVFLAGKTFWSRAAMPRASRVSHSWRCAHQQPLVAQFRPAKPPKQRRPPSTRHFSVLLHRGGELEEEKLMDFNSIRLVRQQVLETTCCPLRPEGYRNKTDAK